MERSQPDELKSGTTHTRSLAISTVRVIDEESRTVEVAFASEEPVRRWWGEEVLVVSREAIRAERLNAGVSVLVNHRVSEHTGISESWSIGPDRVARATLRFGKSAKADEVFRDLVDGIRRWISFGYIVHHSRLVERSDDGPDRWEIDDWEPYEISVVSVPADPSVGVGRSVSPDVPEDDDGDTSDRGRRQPHAPTRESVMPGQNDPTPQNAKRAEGGEATPPVPAVPAQPTAAARAAEPTVDNDAERKRSADILSLGIQFKCVQRAQEAIATGMTLEAFQRGVLESQRNEPLSDDAQAATIGLSKRETRSYSFVRLLRAISNPQDHRAREAAAFEFECHEACRGFRTLKRGGILVPDEVLHERAYSPFNTGTGATDTGDTGGNLVDEELRGESFIEMLRNKAIVMRRSRVLSGLVGDLAIPKQASGGQGYWLGEDDAAPAVSQTVGQVKLTPHTAGAYSEITRKLLMQDSVGVEMLVRSDLAAALALTMDKAAFYGDPDTATDSPRGIKFVDGVNTTTFADAATPTYLELIAMETEIASDNADVDSMAYVFNPVQRGALKGTPKFASTGLPIWENDGRVNGYAAEVTNQVTAGDVFLGNWADLVVGLWGGLEIMLDPYTHSTRGRLRVVTFQDCDFAVRHAESFCFANQEPEE